ncbi:hypothetical protein [Streptomyces melanogenes]|uniref:Uncharacterized protein n=1 Tax=Streptomyces melanogenes TaxID=67326 RepID=A0ABZ1XGC2_9ACTN|nr:hypothetical protein [Streptomyces melanogenes]
MGQIPTMPPERGSEVPAVFAIGEDESGGDLEPAAGGAGTVARTGASLAEALVRNRAGA